MMARTLPVQPQPTLSSSGSTQHWQRSKCGSTHLTRCHQTTPASSPQSRTPPPPLVHAANILPAALRAATPTLANGVITEVQHRVNHRAGIDALALDAPMAAAFCAVLMDGVVVAHLVA